MNLWSHNIKLQSCIKFFSIGLHINKPIFGTPKNGTQAKRTGERLPAMAIFIHQA